ncbi:MAG: SprT family zinc-dependent metalloprotease [bacterium]
MTISQQDDRLYRVKLGDQVIEYSVRRRVRKTIGILVDPVRGVIVTAHPRFSIGELQGIVLRRADWIIRKQNQMKDRAAARAPRRFIEGEYFWYLGKQYPLSIIRQEHDHHSCTGILPRIDFAGDAFRVFLPARIGREEQVSFIRSAFLRWYLARADEVIRQRIEIYRKAAAVVSVGPLTIRVRHQKSCWGSCTAKNALHFNWRLVLSPLPVIDYVVVHELCHLKIKNHSPKFWSFVGSILPDYRDRKAWLRQNGTQLDI